MKKTISMILAIALFLSMALSLAACGQSKSNGPVIRVGSKDFTENLIVAEIYALALEDAGYTVERKLNIAGSVVHTAITSGEIDLYPEYTGTGLLAILQLPMSSDPDEVYNTVKAAYDEQFQITWLDSTDVNDRNGLAIRTEVAQQYNIYTMSDLQREAEHIRVCSQGEFEYREDGIPGMTKVYGPFNFASINVYDNGIKYQILQLRVESENRVIDPACGVAIAGREKLHNKYFSFSQMPVVSSDYWNGYLGPQDTFGVDVLRTLAENMARLL